MHSIKCYFERFKKPVDIIKQPLLDIERFISRLLFNILRAFRVPKARPAVVKKLLLIRRNRLGDAINTLPVIDALKARYPDMQIYVLANPYNAPIFKYAKHVTETFIAPEKSFLGKWGALLTSTYKVLRQSKFDMVVVMSGGYSSYAALMALACGAKYRVGVGSNKGAIYDLVYDQTLQPFEQYTHQVAKMGQLLRSAGFDLPQVLPHVEIRRPLNARGGVVALCPDVARKLSQYPLDHYSELVERIAQFEWAEEIRLFLTNTNSPYSPLVKKTKTKYYPTPSLDDFVSKLSECTYAITAEGGASHLAAALGIPCVVISGVNIKQKWSPWSKNAVILENSKAIDSITPDQILLHLLEFHERRKPAP